MQVRYDYRRLAGSAGHYALIRHDRCANVAATCTLKNIHLCPTKTSLIKNLTRKAKPSQPWPEHLNNGEDKTWM